MQRESESIPYIFWDACWLVLAEISGMVLKVAQNQMGNEVGLESKMK
jgi:hypothetical protein